MLNGFNANVELRTSNVERRNKGNELLFTSTFDVRSWTFEVRFSAQFDPGLRGIPSDTGLVWIELMMAWLATVM